MGLGRGEPNLSRLDVLVSFYNDRCCSGGRPWCEFVDGDYSNVDGVGPEFIIPTQSAQRWQCLTLPFA